MSMCLSSSIALSIYRFSTMLMLLLIEILLSGCLIAPVACLVALACTATQNATCSCGFFLRSLEARLRICLVCACSLMFSESRGFTCFVPDSGTFVSEVKLICGWFHVENGICSIGLSMNIVALIWPESETLLWNLAHSFYPQSTTHCADLFLCAASCFQYAWV
jgi:hypothetical protein